MHHSSDYLFRLVKTTTASEQKEFALLLHNAGKSKNIYGKLFTALLQLKQYNEKKLLQLLKEELNAKTLSVVKVQLHEKLMSYLRTKAPETGNNRIHRLLEEAEILYRRSLYTDAYILADTAYNEAEKLDLKYYLIPANDYRMLTMLHVTESNHHLRIAELTNMGITNAERILFHMQMGKLHEDIHSSLNQNANMRSSKFQRKLQHYLRHPFMCIKETDKRLSFHTKCQLWITRSLLYTYTGQFNKAAADMMKMKNLLLEDWKLYFRFRRKECIAMLVNCLEIFKAARWMSEQKKQLTWVEHILQNELKDHSILQNIYLLNLLDFEIWEQQEKLPHSRLLFFEEHYHKSNWSGMQDNRKLFVNYLSHGHYLLGNYQKAESLLRAVKDDFRRYEYGEDMFEDLQLGYFLIYYIRLLSEGHARNIDDFAREINQYHLRIRRKPKHENYSLEHIVTNLFRRLKPQTTRSQIVKQLQVTEAELERLQKKPYPFLKLVNHSIDIKKWISRCKEHLAN